MVKKSLLNNKWEFLKADVSKATFFSQMLGISYPVCEILSLNPELNLDSAKTFLNPSIRNLMPNPFDEFLDIELGVSRIIHAIKKKERIVIFGDYDVDGAASSAIFKRFFAMLGVKSEIYIPDRVKEGYGPNSNALLEIRKSGANLVITVDCGTVAFEPLEKAKEAGLDIIVVDHHLGIKEKPKSIAVINPNRFDETSNLGYLCGAGVSFMVVVAVNMELKKAGFYNKNGLKEPNLLSLLDLAALGTVCDIMPLIGLNRAFVKTGLEVLKLQTNIGIKALLAAAGSESVPSEFTLGFILGPRINAGGRIGKSSLGARLLSTDSEEEAMQIALELHNLNANRKEMEEEALILAISKIEEGELYKKDIIFVEDESFHQGIIGILAARIKDRYNKPVGVFSRFDGYLKASFRSITGLDIGRLIQKANKAGLLIAGGGHEMAGGISVLEENYHKTFNFFESEIKNDDITFQKTLYISSIISMSGANQELCLSLKKLAPFGNSNPKPIFCLKNSIVVKFDALKESHASMILKDKTTGECLKAMFFKAAQLGILQSLEKLKGKEIDAAGELELNEWNGNKNVTLNLIDVCV